MVKTTLNIESVGAGDKSFFERELALLASVQVEGWEEKKEKGEVTRFQNVLKSLREEKD